MTSMRLTSTCCQEEKEAGCQEDAIVHGAEGVGRAAHRCHGSVSRSRAKKFELALNPLEINSPAARSSLGRMVFSLVSANHPKLQTWRPRNAPAPPRPRSSPAQRPSLRCAAACRITPHLLPSGATSGSPTSLSALRVSSSRRTCRSNKPKSSNSVKNTRWRYSPPRRVPASRKAENTAKINR